MTIEKETNSCPCNQQNMFQAGNTVLTLTASGEYHDWSLHDGANQKHLQLLADQPFSDLVSNQT